MKKLFFLAVVVSALLACSNTNDTDTDLNGGNSVVGKLFQYSYEYESNGLPSEDIYTISFPTRGTCQFSISGYYYDFDVKKYIEPFTETLDYIVNGNKIITEESSYNNRALVFTYSKNALTNEYGDVYIYNGNVDIDEDLDAMFDPNRKRTYLPVGWYESGNAEYWFDKMASDLVAAGDYVWLEKLGKSHEEFGTTAIHVVDENTIEYAVATCSTKQPTGYYATRSYSTNGHYYTFYFYYTYPYSTFKYRIVDNILYTKDLTYKDEGWKKSEIVVSGNTIQLGGMTYQKNNYSGEYGYVN